LKIKFYIKKKIMKEYCCIITLKYSSWLNLCCFSWDWILVIAKCSVLFFKSSLKSWNVDCCESILLILNQLVALRKKASSWNGSATKWPVADNELLCSPWEIRAAAAALSFRQCIWKHSSKTCGRSERIDVSSTL